MDWNRCLYARDGFGGIGLTREAGWSPARSRHCIREQDHIYVTGAIWEGVVERWSGARRTACLAITVRPASDGKGIFLQLCAWILAFGQDFFVAYFDWYLLYKCCAWIVQIFLCGAAVCVPQCSAASFHHWQWWLWRKVFLCGFSTARKALLIHFIHGCRCSGLHHCDRAPEQVSGAYLFFSIINIVNRKINNA